jgi:hypothetical protein
MVLRDVRLVLRDVRPALGPRDAARFTFLDPRAQTLYRDWPGNARQVVALLRGEAGRSPHDRILTDLVGEAGHPQRALPHPVGVARRPSAPHRVEERAPLRRRDLDLTFEAMDLTSEPGLQLLAFSAAPGSASHDGLRLLATWAATTQLDPSSNDGPATDTTDKA